MQRTKTLATKEVEQSQQGFTIIELMIATTVFSVILLLCAFGLIQVGRYFNKGIVTSRTQEAARTVAEQLAESLQLGGGTYRRLNDTGDIRGYCMGNKRFSYVLDRQQVESPAGADQVRRALVADDVDCGAVSEPLDILNTAGGRLILGERMRVTAIDIDEVPNVLDTYRIRVKIATGENTLFNGSDNCLSGSGSSFCATSEFETVVQRRL